jgi:hypothetical protein
VAGLVERLVAGLVRLVAERTRVSLMMFYHPNFNEFAFSSLYLGCVLPSDGKMQLSLDAVETLESLNHRLTHLECKLGMQRHEMQSEMKDTEIKRWTVRFHGMSKDDQKRAWESGAHEGGTLILMKVGMGEIYYLKWGGLITPRFHSVNANLNMSAAEAHLKIHGFYSGSGGVSAGYRFRIDFSDGTGIRFAPARCYDENGTMMY